MANGCSCSVINGFRCLCGRNNRDEESAECTRIKSGDRHADSGISVDLEHKEQGKWVKLSSGVTDKNGRISALFPTDKQYETGDYKVVFKTGDYYQKVQHASFFPEIPVIFHMDKSESHYHIPLLLSPYGYSTYRGN